MNSSNRGTNDKQEELVKRLEEIRNRRNAPATPSHEMETQTKKQTPRRNQRTPNPAPSRSKRNEQAQKRQASPQSSQQRQGQQPATPKKMAYEIERRKRQEAIAKKRSKRTKKTKSPKSSKTLIQQLSDGQSVADAIVLSEVLSKPIALRKRNR